VTLLGCSFSSINLESKFFVKKLSYDLSIPEKIKNDLNIYIKENKSSLIEVKFFEFEIKENNFYGGKNLGSLESEIVGSIQIQGLTGDTKKIISSKRFNTQSLNPLAQKELIKSIENQVIKDLNKKILLYLKGYENK
tara:strand:- start:1761 stop:2171 length:411 start_codon:yes stop_codon:yes gene_type:complete